MLVVLALTALAVLAAVVALAMGKGGELARAHPDHPPLRMPTGRRLTGADVALLHLPHGLWGYQVDITDEALRRLADALDERDAQVAALEARIAELHRRHGVGDDPAPWNGRREPVWDEAPPGTGPAGHDSHDHDGDDGLLDIRPDVSGKEAR